MRPKIVQALLDYDLIAIDDWIEELFNRFKRIDSKHEVYEHMVHSIVHLKEQLYAMNENFDSLMEWTAPFPISMLEFDTLLDMKSWLRRNFFSLSERWHNKRNGQQRKLIDEIMHYVKEQIDKEITLKKTADHFGFNANYLGQLFKQETGQHFSNFIIEQRFNKACELLRDPTLKVYEIAERIGYKNIVYFNRLFKQSAGMSPGDYRKRLLI